MTGSGRSLESTDRVLVSTWQCPVAESSAGSGWHRANFRAFGWVGAFGFLPRLFTRGSQQEPSYRTTCASWHPGERMVKGQSIDAATGHGRGSPAFRMEAASMSTAETAKTSAESCPRFSWVGARDVCRCTWSAARRFPGPVARGSSSTTRSRMDVFGLRGAYSTAHQTHAWKDSTRPTHTATRSSAAEREVESRPQTKDGPVSPRNTPDCAK
jgi:hypothetical protein